MTILSGRWFSKNWKYAYEQTEWAEKKWGRFGHQVAATYHWMRKMSRDVLVISIGTIIFAVDWTVRGLRQWGRQGQTTNLWNPDAWRL